MHLQHDGSKQPEHNDFTLNKNALNEYNSYRTQSTSCMALLLGIRQEYFGNSVLNLCIYSYPVNKFYGVVAGDRKSLVDQYSDERRKC